MKIPKPGELFGILTQKAAEPVISIARKGLAGELAKWELTVDLSIPLGGQTAVRMDEFSVRLKKASKPSNE